MAGFTATNGKQKGSDMIIVQILAISSIFSGIALILAEKKIKKLSNKVEHLSLLIENLKNEADCYHQVLCNLSAVVTDINGSKK